jgi:hypothetical protein
MFSLWEQELFGRATWPDHSQLRQKEKGLSKLAESFDVFLVAGGGFEPPTFGL